VSRRFQFSAKALLLVITGTSVWLAILSQHARRQVTAVAQIEALGGIVYYQHQDVSRLRGAQPVAAPLVAAPRYDRCREPPASPWLRNLLGDDFFREVAVIDLRETAASDAEIAQFGSSLPQAAIRCPASWARRHDRHNIWPMTLYHYDYHPISLAVTLATLAFTSWMVVLSYGFFRRKSAV
jgi:hypothetical protein